MKICEYALLGANQNEISTELKFHLASSRFDGAQLMKFVYSTNDTDREATKMRNIVIKVLRSLRAKKIIQFFVMPESFDEGSTEAAFLLNKFPDYFSKQVSQNSEEGCFYIML